MWEYSCRDTAVDLGSTTVRMHVRGRGVVAREPSVLARSRSSGRILALGSSAQELAGLTDEVSLIEPIRDGAPAEPDETEYLLRHLVRTHHRRRYTARPRMVVAVPSDLTPLQYEAVESAAYQAGARQLELVPTPLAAAAGSGPAGTGADVMIVADIGAYITDIGIIAFGGLVSSHMARIGGAALDRAIVAHVRREHEVLLSRAAAEAAKLAVGSVAPRGRQRTRQAMVHGRDLATGLPRPVVLTAAEINRAIAGAIAAMVDAIRIGIGRCSPEISGDLMSSGLTLTGAAARLPGLDRLIGTETGLRTRVGEDAADAAVLGAAEFLRHGVPRGGRFPLRKARDGVSIGVWPTRRCQPLT
ncbi:rod shape-determining protein [Spirillospora sp. NBC_01491]|uniref:rod shape-determining protein n=1 Tax=Spirillospora sp. NBC_01491 TaxID=2976007 RepID=UPI002E3445AE|nr:rod shape-determining protein [Spirillospora sp. NBC_01491]